MSSQLLSMSVLKQSVYLVFRTATRRIDEDRLECCSCWISFVLAIHNLFLVLQCFWREHFMMIETISLACVSVLFLQCLADFNTSVSSLLSVVQCGSYSLLDFVKYWLEKGGDFF